MCYPDWIKKAHQQLDEVVGPDRLPNFDDREKMPYIEAICRGSSRHTSLSAFRLSYARMMITIEVLRWRPAARFGIPHKATEDDVVEYNGKEYFIPKDTTIIGVPWSDTNLTHSH